ncbi:MarR family winged helix-turn-helix transcriptional regulator [Streptomyces sp. WMMB303]|uniref:MarR family winged helix-turn-helix transcriptional regulator n=1 Tax=Streptomyces sp. WMMB303 TaxID=3034154 RepID=UPI0023EBE8FF|nr:MarR family winged helix-turn-helix transcriptional regulator [Streptomyces sp. WMMB303]MDF4249134.1 MarR family winged helix-turn-helix transcriptional regulator [Streptomyces sp. WMMB303]
MADTTPEGAPSADSATASAIPSAPAVLTTAPGYQVRRLYQAHLAGWLRTVGPTLTGPQFAVLTTVGASPGCDQSSLAAAVALDTSTMADLARRLEDRGLLERRTAAADGRRKLLFLTAEGEKALREADERARELNERLLAPYEPADRERLLRELTALADDWERLSTES